MFRLSPSSSALLSTVSLPPSHEASAQKQLVRYYSAYIGYPPTCSAPDTANAPVAFVAKHFSERAEAALGLFNAASFSAAQQSSSGSSQARKRLCTSASQREREREGEEN